MNQLYINKNKVKTFIKLQVNTIYNKITIIVYVFNKINRKNKNRMKNKDFIYLFPKKLIFV